jgi:hypothetical protein
MSFDNATYPNRKDWRKPYLKGAKRFDRSCRPNGGCGYCRDNRLNADKKARTVADEKLAEYHAAPPGARSIFCYTCGNQFEITTWNEVAWTQGGDIYCPVCHMDTVDPYAIEALDD